MLHKNQAAEIIIQYKMKRDRGDSSGGGGSEFLVQNEGQDFVFLRGKRIWWSGGKQKAYSG